MACGTRPGSNSEDQDGIVDGHAYTVLRIVENAGGTDFDLVQVRNPWHQVEFTSGMWDDDGLGWEEYPEVKDALEGCIMPSMCGMDLTFSYWSGWFFPCVDCSCLA